MSNNIPVKGDIIKFKNGLIGEFVALHGRGYGATVEAIVLGTRVYRELEDVEVPTILDRIVNAVNKAEQQERNAKA